jgi:lipopolysaccharide transport system ATP-binding protein
MYVRLAFAVAAHLEPEILLVDEVLAVGDAAFQKKCLGKMGDVAREGRTVLFVSHNLAAVRRLCDSALLLVGGYLNLRGSTHTVIHEYLKSLPHAASPEMASLAHNRDCGVKLNRMDLLDDDSSVVNVMQTGSPIVFRLLFETDNRFENVLVSIGIDSSADDVRVCLFHSQITGYSLALDPPYTTVLCIVPRILLSPGRYSITLKVVAGSEELFYLPEVREVEVAGGDFYGTGRLPDKWGGVCLIEHSWKVVADNYDRGHQSSGV